MAKKQMTNREYVKASGTTCPDCESDVGVECAGQLEISSGQIVTQSIRCRICGALWVDLYKLKGFDNLERGNSADGEEAKEEEEEEDQGDLA